MDLFEKTQLTQKSFKLYRVDHLKKKYYILLGLN